MTSDEQYFTVVLFMLYYAVQGGSNFESVDDQILKCGHLNESWLLIFPL